ncbi:DNA (cytosine-5)-methyltransferase 1 [Croceifilum oryzae]|uniref:Cytosine-specific methyltransferase n=1 Tax=Croceifilum oryzae TaxID=1553429 RepID=A0AAJ1TKD4_9BACL|nr:DNA cytosine methyltransferase [Croceifilum oryzae]MDQ0418477.1 DNA (cytosine-5)-methyltransferase 1 [Croceifilum oryzae]
MKCNFDIVSLFAGAGGLDMGFESEGFKTIWANDIDSDACETHRNWSNAEVVCSDIKKTGLESIPDCDVVLGGFPCQGFSASGPRKLDDSRNTLYRYFVNVVQKKKPLAFVGENVKGLLTLGNGVIMEAIINDFESKGYKLYYQLLNAADYGVPQDRHRVILVGLRKDLEAEFIFPQPTGYVTLKEALAGIPEPDPSDVCEAPFSSRYMSRNRKRDWIDRSYTIPAMAKQITLHPSSPDMIKIGQDEWMFGEGKTRRFSWQEAAVIQTFPRDMKFVGNLVSKYRQIGNAVPPTLAKVIAKQLYSTLEEAINMKKKVAI